MYLDIVGRQLAFLYRASQNLYVIPGKETVTISTTSKTNSGTVYCSRTCKAVEKTLYRDEITGRLRCTRQLNLKFGIKNTLSKPSGASSL